VKVPSVHRHFFSVYPLRLLVRLRGVAHKRQASIFFVYCVGFGSIFIADALVTKFFSVDEIARWAEVRALIGISGVLCLIGLDQVLVRSRASSGKLLMLLSIQVPLLALLVGTIVWWFGFLSSWIIAVLLAVGSAGTVALFQYFRSNNQRLKAQVTEQSWKIALLLALIWLVASQSKLPLDALVVGLMLAGVCGSAFMVWRRPPASLYPQSPQPTQKLYAIGGRFMATSLLLALALYAEQLVVNGLGSSQEGARYFTHATYFLFPISVANGYFAFLLGPWARDNHAQFMALLSRSRWLILMVAFGYTAIVHFIGWAGWILIGPAAGEPDLGLRIIFFTVCITRTLYTFPSTYVGVFALPQQHDFLILGQIIVLSIVAIVFFLLYQTLALPLVVAVAGVSAINWILRTALGFGVMRDIMCRN
jgi:hypothetical protein